MYRLIFRFTRGRFLPFSPFWGREVHYHVNRNRRRIKLRQNVEAVEGEKKKRFRSARLAPGGRKFDGFARKAFKCVCGFFYTRSVIVLVLLRGCSSAFLRRKRITHLLWEANKIGGGAGRRGD